MMLFVTFVTVLRCLLQCNLSDFTDNQWVTFFQDTAETVLGHSAEEIGQFKTEGVGLACSSINIYKYCKSII